MDSMKSNFGVADPLVEGLKQQRSQLQKAHPLQASEAEYDGNVLRSELKLAREIQGLHAPIRLMMEHKSVSKVGHLPCISQRSNLLADVLTGRDGIIAPGDVFGKRENYEGLSTPHNIIERTLNKGQL